MKVSFTNHARIRLYERGIPVEFIKQAIKNPDKEKHTFKNRTQIQKNFSGKVLEIICVKTLNKVVILTFYYI